MSALPGRDHEARIDDLSGVFTSSLLCRSTWAPNVYRCELEDYKSPTINSYWLAGYSS